MGPLTVLPTLNQEKRQINGRKSVEFVFFRIEMHDTRLSFSSAKVDAAILAICPLRRRSLPTPSTLSPAHDVAFAVSVPRRQPPNSSASIAF
nr:hypothetical protein Iba_chr14bCG10590 [Ipomoea batatas]